MSMEAYRRRYESFDDIVANGLNGRDSRRVQHNTFIQTRERDCDGLPRVVAVLLHNTDVLTFDREGIVYDTGGWASTTTKQRLNTYGPVYIYQRDYTWYWTDKGGVEHLFWSGMKLGYDGQLLNLERAPSWVQEFEQWENIETARATMSVDDDSRLRI